MIIQTIKEKIGIIPIEAFSRESGFTKRAPKKISAIDYVSSFISCVFEGDISQSNWARTLSIHLGQPISTQAIQNKVQVRHEAFCQGLLSLAIEHSLQLGSKQQRACSILRSFKRVMVHDSTCIQLPGGLHEQFPGSRSQHGSSAIARTQLSIDLHSGSYHNITISSFRENDQSYAMAMAELAQAEELHLFDLGYFKLAALEQILKSKASFLCRYNSIVNIYRNSEGPALELAKELKKLDKKGLGYWDNEVFLGAKQKLKVRMIAIKVPQKVAQARRRKKKTDRDRRKKYLEPYLYLLGWNIFITNIEQASLNATQILRVYGLRWRIEIIFKAWKSKLNYAQLFANQSFRLPSRAIIQLNLLLFTITLFLTNWYYKLTELVFDKTGKILSLFKFCSLIKTKTSFFFDLYCRDQKALIKLLAYHYCYDRRKDRLNFFENLYDKKLS